MRIGGVRGVVRLSGEAFPPCAATLRRIPPRHPNDGHESLVTSENIAEGIGFIDTE
ncbi:hypothetical protein ACE1SV_23360 [Streptomyces sennicomposti]